MDQSVGGKFYTSANAQKIRELDPKQLKALGIKGRIVVRNLSVPEIYENSVKALNPADPTTRSTVISQCGALVAYSGERTGRSPADKRVVKDDLTKDDIYWGNVNIPLDNNHYKLMEQIATDYLNTRPRLYVIDGYAGWDPKYRKKVRVIATRSYHCLFMKNMLIEPTEDELKNDFDVNGVDFHILNAGEFPAPGSELIPGIDQKRKCCVTINFSARKMVILGTQYAGEMKKGVFTIMNYYMPKNGVLSLHSSANEGKNGDVTIFFGLSGTGKTTLSADPNRQLIGDDEHCWSDDGVFNIEGGCYAKCINLSAEKEPDIYDAIKFGAVLENVTFTDELKRIVDYDSDKITENTRACYPLQHIKNAKLPAVGGHPSNLIFLTCDSFGVLPPISKLSPEQAMYHFISGYTSKVAGTEVGIKEPQSTFSPCFGEAFLPLHPTVYAEMLAKKMQKFNVNCWLLNTGWSGGKYGVGNRMSLSVTRKILDAVHNGELLKQEFELFPIFGFQIPKTCPNVDPFILNPRNTWVDKGGYDKTIGKLVEQFQKHFKLYEEKASEAIKNAGPKL